MFQKFYLSIFLLIFITNGFSQKLTFEKTKDSSNKSQIIISDFSSKEKVDAKEDIYRFAYFSNYNNKINLSLEVDCILNIDVQENEERSLCFKPNIDTEEKCFSIDEIPQEITEMYQLELTKLKRGFIFTISKNNKNRNIELSGIFSCKISDVQSQDIKISDPGHYFQNFFNNEEIIQMKPIKKTDFPVKFSCTNRPYEKYQELVNSFESSVSPFTYKFCKVTSTQKTSISCGKYGNTFNTSIAQITGDGSLLIHDRTLFSDGDIGIICISTQDMLPKRSFIQESNDLNQFVKGLSIDQNSEEQYEFKEISLLKRESNLLIGTENFEITNVYKEPFDGSTFKWSKDNVEIKDWECDKYTLKFKKPISFNDAGSYKLTLKSTEYPGKEMEFEHKIQVHGPPEFADQCVPTMGYVLNGNELNIPCQLKNKAKFEISLDMFKNKTPSEFNEIISPKKVDFNTKPEVTSLDLTLSGLQRKEKISLKVFAKNKYGTTISHGLIEVIPSIVPKESLKVHDCSVNCMNETRKLIFETDKEEEQKLSDLGIKVTQDWTLNQKVNLEDLDEKDELWKYIDYNKMNKTSIVIKPDKKDGLLQKAHIKRKNTLEDYLAERLNDKSLTQLDIEARVRYYIEANRDVKMATPQLTIAPELKQIDGKNYKLLYDSVYSNKKNQESPLKATLNFDQPPTQASLGWIAALIFGLIAFLILTIVCCYYCRKSSKSKTYEPRKKEEKRGLSPDSNFNSDRPLQPLISQDSEKVFMKSDVVSNKDVEDSNLDESDLKIARQA